MARIERLGSRANDKSTVMPGSGEKSWQVDLSSKSVKKLEKYETIERIIPDCEGKVCLEIGAETGVITAYLRRHKAGRWIAGSLDDKWRDISLDLLKEDVVTVDPDSVSFDDATFDIVLVSRPEHIRNDARLLGEVFRVLKKGGDIFVLTPHKGRLLFLNWVKEKVGLTLERYDHYRPGYSSREMRDMLEKTGFEVKMSGSYCRFFSEIIELKLNAVYAFMNRKKAAAGRKDESVEPAYRPATEKDVTRHRSLFRLYGIIFPILRCFSRLDRLLFFTPGYVMYMQGRKG